MKSISEIKQVRLPHDTLLETSFDAVIRTDLDFLVVSWNAAATSMYGWDATEVVGQNLCLLASTAFVGDQVDDLSLILRKEGRWRGEAVPQRKNGTRIRIDASISLLTESNGEPAGALFVLRDITARKVAEEKFDSLLNGLDGQVDNSQLVTEEHYKILFESTSDAMFVSRPPDGVVVATNSSAEALLGYSKSEMFNRIGTDFIAPEVLDLATQAWTSQVSSSGEFLIETLWVHKLGNRIPVSIKGKPVLIGGVEHFLLSGHDLSGLKRAEQERAKLEAHLHQQQRLEALGTLAGGVAHEINNPVGGIMNYAQLISDRLDRADPLRQFAQEILRETQRVSSIVASLLSFAGHARESIRPTAMAAILDDTLMLIRSVLGREQIQLEVDVPHSLPNVLCRSQQIQQVLMNLITNARDALKARDWTSDAGRVLKLTGRRLEKGDQGWVRITVEDHGIGIAKELHGQLFDPFFTTKDRAHGTGLGLSISYGIVREHGGELSFESEPGRGTRFHIDLPADTSAC